MEEFSVSGFRPRNHRKKGVMDKKAVLYVKDIKEKIMENSKQFKNPPNIREYWRIHKAQERAEKAKQ